MCMNYFVDPYNIFTKYKYINFSRQSQESIPILIKASQKSKFDTVFWGSSELSTLFFIDKLYSNYISKFSVEEISLKTEYDAIKNYLFIHPETKRVFVFISYPSLFSNKTIKIENIDNMEYSLNELAYLLLSKETTFKTIDKINRIILKKIGTNKTTGCKFVSYPKRYSQLGEKIISDDITKPAFLYLIKMVELFKEKNIDYTFVISPVHSVYQATLFAEPQIQDYLNNIKRLLVNLSDNDVYDFAIFSKETTIDYDSSDNYYWIDYVHANELIGYKMFKILHGDVDVPGFYQLLNKNNIETELNKQNKILRLYYTNNHDLIHTYIERGKQKTTDNYKIVRDYENAPDYIRQEFSEYRDTIDAMQLNNSVNHITKWK